ncbi:Ovule protein [Caenorhabditis elegans]|uniref:Ovule protein n=1 Tax=Caenorhabditis elegans TaxID=6239 RepID=Q21631_CAEEL|nr:Ovule protein [Caenorhabditis elegans]CCD69282.1 Ovule protein [Caenorhabditis elegans]|eukprot:NP_498539.1 Uncharacterized protein CELE_R01H2.1 [Caenorhabditis elegans]
MASGKATSLYSHAEIFLPSKQESGIKKKSGEETQQTKGATIESSRINQNRAERTQRFQTQCSKRKPYEIRQGIPERSSSKQDPGNKTASIEHRGRENPSETHES